MTRSSIVKAGAILVLLRLVGVAVRYLVQPTGPLLTRLAIFSSAAMFHTGALLLIISAFVAAAALLPSLRSITSAVACVVFLILAIAGQLDLTLTWITGEPLTPTVFRTFRGFYIVRSTEFLDPLKANLGLAISGGMAFALAAGGMLAFLVAEFKRRDFRMPAWKHQALAVCVSAALMVAGGMAPWAWATPPVEAAFAREYLGLDAVRPTRSDADAIKSLRAMLGLPKGTTWLSEEYPLVYGRKSPGPTMAPPVSELPDIVVVMIETLRPEQMGFMSGMPGDTPNLDALAARSVVFPLYTSNGFPTAPSIIAFHGSGWPHRRKEIVTDFPERHFDELPPRLADLGYDTRYIGADSHLDKLHLLLPRWYDHAVDLVGMGVAPIDSNTFHLAVEDIRLHDRSMPNRPLFAFVSTLSTHYPFIVPDDGGELAVVPAGETVEARYRRTLRYTDRRAGELLTFLESRARSDNTITIVMGDHSFYLDLAATSGLPENDNIWTSMIFHGPARLVGPPRWVYEPASHVDILPTLLALTGDRRPSAALGADLFGRPRNGVRTAVAVRPGGVRLDRDGYSYIVDPRTPAEVIVKPAFPGRQTPAAHPGPPVNPIELGDWVSEYSRLIERDRVWSETFLRQP